MRKDFVVFILTHGRPNHQKTYSALKRSNYTGDLYFVLDDEDKTIDEYKKNYGEDKILIFNKEEVAKNVDEVNNFKIRKCILFTRNVCFELAKKLGYKYFLELDDDYTVFEHRVPVNGKLAHITCKNLDLLFDKVINFLEKSKALSVCLAQGGDFIGGEGSNVYKHRLSRKAMNSWFCSVDRPFEFYGTFNDDVNTYVEYQKKGELFFTIADALVQQEATQSISGGMSETYGKYGTYCKSFLSVIMNPSSVKIQTMGVSNRRIHHRILWNYAVPKIINQKYKKEVNNIV